MPGEGPPCAALTEQRKTLRLIFSEVRVDLFPRLLPSSRLHTPFAYLLDLDQSITRAISGDDGGNGSGGPATRYSPPDEREEDGAFAPSLVDSSFYRLFGTPERT